MGKISFEDFEKQLDPRHNVPVANVDDIERVVKEIRSISGVKTEVIREKVESKAMSIIPELNNIASKLEALISLSSTPKSNRVVISNPTSNKPVVDAINGLKSDLQEMKNIKIEMPKIPEKEEKEEIKLSCYKVSDAAEPVVGTQYFGFISPDGSWYILYNDAVESAVRYKFGKEDYRSAWDKREYFDYKLLNEAYDEIKD